MLCGARTAAGTPCKKSAMSNGSTRCMKHGGLSPRGKSHWNYKHGWRTKEAIERSKETMAQIKLLEVLAIKLGMIEK